MKFTDGLWAVKEGYTIEYRYFRIRDHALRTVSGTGEDTKLHRMRTSDRTDQRGRSECILDPDLEP